MNDLKAALITIVEVVTFLFAAFNSHLTGIAPPASRIGAMRADFAVGVASFAMLLIFLLAKSLIPTGSVQRHRTVWLVIAAVLTVGYMGLALAYAGSFNAHTFVYAPTDSIRSVEVVGDDFTPHGDSMAANFRRVNHSDPLPGELIAYSEGNDPAHITRLWTIRSVVSVHNRLIYLYIGMVVLLASAVASLLELTRSSS